MNIVEFNPHMILEDFGNFSKSLESYYHKKLYFLDVKSSFRSELKNKADLISFVV